VRIGKIEQETSDLDWFAVDEKGSLAHFASAGFKYLPATVACSAEDLALVTDYFQSCATTFSGHIVNADIGRDRCDWNGEAREARYLRSFVEMAGRGLYSYDIESYVKPTTAYFCVAIPTRALSIEDLPEAVRNIVRRTVLKGVRLQEIPRIEYESTLRF
jgi:hypothetical protein